MSGRSAYVRKEKTKTKDGVPAASEGSSERSVPAIEDLSDQPVQPHRDTPSRSHSDLPHSKSNLSTSDDMAYARARKPQVPILDVSGIEKSSFRVLMDKKSDGVRRGLARTFGKKKKEISRSETGTIIHPEHRNMDDNLYVDAPTMASRRRQQDTLEQLEYTRPGPPQGKLPPIPQGPQLKRWIGGGRPVQPWNKLRKDPELWDANGDTLVYFGRGDHHSSKSPASFRLSSHILESTESRYFMKALREGSTDEVSGFGFPPSPMESPTIRLPQSALSGRSHYTPPLSETSTSVYDGQISYELYFPPPPHLGMTESLRHQVSTRNVFAILYQASFVGINFVQALKDVQERLENYMPPDVDVPSLIVEYIVGKGMDDIRENPSLAAAMLAWSEGEAIRWEEAWRESFVHCVGMYSKVEESPDYRFITPITRALLERASLEMQVRIQNCEDRLLGLDFGDVLPLLTPHLTTARKAFDNLRKFLLEYYRTVYGSWPPIAPVGEEQWLSREHAQRLQADFGALYNYFVNRDVVWESDEASSGRKWNMVNRRDRSFEPDTAEVPLTDVLVAFDNRHKYPHIPYPYPLVPESTPIQRPKENRLKASKRSPKAFDDKMAEKKAALAYTESTNIYLLGSDFIPNDLVDDFIRFEKTDKATDADPIEARLGRWVLIYAILQTLATISVDTPNLLYVRDVSYHLSPQLRGTPPWRGAPDDAGGAEHARSYCWTVPATWVPGPGEWGGHSRFSGSGTADGGSVRRDAPWRNRWTKESDSTTATFVEGPVRGSMGREGQLMIKDFDEYEV